MLRNKLKKGELTFNQIVVAAIALTVLIIVILIFSGNIEVQSNSVNSCAMRFGECKGNSQDCSGVFLNQNFSDCSPQEGCCVSPLGSSSEE